MTGLTLSSEDAEFKYLAQKCFVSYFKSVWLQASERLASFHLRTFFHIRSTKCGTNMRTG